MAAEEDLERLLEAWTDRLQRLSTYSAVGLLLGHTEAFITQTKDNGRGPRLLDLLRSLEVAGDPYPNDVFHDAFCPLGIDPALLLRCAREFQNLPEDRFLKIHAPRLLALAEAGPTNEGIWWSRENKIKELDELRRRDRELAKERLHHVISHSLDTLGKMPARPAKAYADLAHALGVLAALYRLAGRRDAAMDALLLAWPLARHAGKPLAVARWYQKTIFLLVDLKRCNRAYEFAHEALKYYLLARSPEGQAQALADVGYVQNHALLPRLARESLEGAIGLLPEADRANRFGAHQILAKLLSVLGEHERALQQLDLAIGLIEDDVLALAAAYSNRAKIAARLGDTDLAYRSFEAALPLYVRQGGAAEVAELGIEYAALLWQEKRRPELKKLAADLSGWIHELRSNRKMRDAIADFKALIDLGTLDEASFGDVRARIAEAGKRLAGSQEVKP